MNSNCDNPGIKSLLWSYWFKKLANVYTYILIIKFNKEFVGDYKDYNGLMSDFHLFILIDIYFQKYHDFN